MTDILCPVCNHSINQHQAQGCYTRRPASDKTPGDYCPCRQSAADIALHFLSRITTVVDEMDKEYGLHCMNLAPESTKMDMEYARGWNECRHELAKWLRMEIQSANEKALST